MNCISQICCFHVALISCLTIIRVYHIFVSISTCALREEGDRLLKAQKEGKLYISIHALREEGDMYSARAPRTSRHFYPRPPRGGRHPGRVSTGGQPNFYPRPPRGGRPAIALWCHKAGKISIHALREEGDAGAKPQRSVNYISIHALREEGDTPQARLSWRSCSYFYPRPPRGGRRSSGLETSGARKFLSTPSARRATRLRRCVQDALKISIHALREEGDAVMWQRLGRP